MIMVLKYIATIRLFLNNQMDFSAKPGVPNLYGLTGTEPTVSHQEKEC
jgi:gamma-glutamyltranspeptidase/glutathione hydrolase